MSCWPAAVISVPSPKRFTSRLEDRLEVSELSAEWGALPPHAISKARMERMIRIRFMMVCKDIYSPFLLKYNPALRVASPGKNNMNRKMDAMFNSPLSIPSSAVTMRTNPKRKKPN